MTHVLCFDCPACGKEHVIGENHKDVQRPGIYTVACCSRSYRVTIDDITLREKSGAELATLGPVDSNSWV
jgi:hypothetical protein